VLLVKSVDLASNLSAAVPYAWTVDVTAPAQPSFSSAPQQSTTDTDAVFVFASEAGSSFTCSVDGATPVYCASPLTLNGLALGAHTLVVTAEDAAHNASQRSHSWTVVAPTPPQPGGPDPTPDPAPAPPAPAPAGDPAPAPAPAPAPTAAGSAAPTATLTTSTALRGTSSVQLSTDVRGVSSDSVVLSDATGAKTLSTLVCKSASAAVVGCSTQSVRSVLVTPQAPLVPGQRYTLSVTGGVVDAAGTATVPTTATFRASTSEQESSLRAGYTWSKLRTASAYGRSYLVESHKGATVSYRFTGPKVTWYTMTGPSQGVAKVFVDGVRKAKVNNYSPANTWRVARSLKGLGTGSHTLKVVVTGRKGSTRATGTSVVFDAAKVGRKLAMSPATTTLWRRAASTSASGGSYALAAARGASASFAFRGTSIAWSTRTAPTMGKAKVYVDGVLKATVDNFSKRARSNVLRSVTGLSDSVHTVKVVVTGSKRKAAKGTDVVLDRWIVG
jgi:hypothetical protein